VASERAKDAVESRCDINSRLSVSVTMRTSVGVVSIPRCPKDVAREAVNLVVVPFLFNLD